MFTFTLILIPLMGITLAQNQTQTQNQTLTTNPPSDCWSGQCLNGGSCFVDNFGNSSCSCPFGYSGTYCETKTACTYLSCQNGGTCMMGDNYISLNVRSAYYYTNEYCKCPSNYTGLLCDIKNVLPAMIFTPDEQCQQVLGDSFVADRNQFYDMGLMYNSYICSYLSCISLNEVNSYVGIVASNGTLCAPGALCMSGQCVNITNAPQTVYFDNVIGSKNCSEYLSADKNYAKSLCSTSYGQKRCPTACKKYSLFKCNDTLNECSQFGSYCKNTYPGTTTLISDLCPFTCNSTKCGIPLTCSTASTLCMNGAKCANVTGSKIGFKCTCVNNFTGEFCELRNPCLSNPCRSNKKCNKIGSYAYMCS